MDLSLYTLNAKVVFPSPGMPTMEMTSISAGPLILEIHEDGIQKFNQTILSRGYMTWFNIVG
ncbi:hypothetical protein H5410_047342 [Solanum commersonii]|uniref:Uncharacterized protein n=1 Tax=Solanum commersonii TaxID=4109 RepID=A0A9J5XI03_SOLCO|nr:hypothetical protein H5410_047342 [Solanum commersonii]